MIAKKYKLPIAAVKEKKGRVYKKPYFTIKVFTNNLNFSRFGVVISKKVFAKATDRNNLKRMLFRLAAVMMKKWPTADYLIVVSPEINKLDKKQINDQFISQFFS